MPNRFQDIRKKTNSEGKQFYRETFIPKALEQEGDLYFITQPGDRLDLIAYEFYQDVSLWWVLASANPITTRRDSYMVKPGQQFRVPVDPTDIINQYNQLNNSR